MMNLVMTRLLYILLSLTFLGIIAADVKDWYKASEENNVNCADADRYKCENIVRWEIICEEECRQYACPECRDKYMSCGEWTIESKECKTDEGKRGCPKTCEICKCPKKQEL